MHWKAVEDNTETYKIFKFEALISVLGIQNLFYYYVNDMCALTSLGLRRKIILKSWVNSFFYFLQHYL